VAVVWVEAVHELIEVGHLIAVPQMTDVAGTGQSLMWFSLPGMRTADAESDGTPLSDLVVNPSRLNRLGPRVIKRRMKEYTLMKKPRQALRKALQRKKNAA
jgi:hypothetical protein